MCGGGWRNSPPHFFNLEPTRKVLYWRLQTPQASKALITLRTYRTGTIVVAKSLPESHFKFSEDFGYAFSVLCANYDLRAESTACFEEFLDTDCLGLHNKKYMEFRVTGYMLHREILREQEFYDLINRLKAREK